MFSWATDLLVTLFNEIIPLEHLTERDTLILMGFSFYLSYPFIFISIGKSVGVSIFALFTSIIFGVMGFGASMIPSPLGWILLFIYPIVGIGLGSYCFIVYLLMECCESELIQGIIAFINIPIALVVFIFCGIVPTIIELLKFGDYQLEFDLMDIILGTVVALIAFTIMSFPILYEKASFIIALFVIYALIVIGVFIACFVASETQQITEWAISGFQMLSQLFVIPIISNLVEITKSNEGASWQIITFTALIPLASTFLLNIFLNLTRHSSVRSEYKGIRMFFSVFDIAFKYAYAFASSYDESLWGCISIEFVTLISICIVCPYRFKYRYVVSIGECVVVIISNFLAKFHKDPFSPVETILILSSCAVPVILSLYTFFLCDFGKRKPFENETDLLVINIICIITVFIGSFFYGWCINDIY